MFDLTKFINSFKYAFNGISYSIKHNQNIKFHIAVAFVVIIVGFLVGLGF